MYETFWNPEVKMAGWNQVAELARKSGLRAKNLGSSHVFESFLSVSGIPVVHHKMPYAKLRQKRFEHWFQLNCRVHSKNWFEIAECKG